MHIYSKDQQAFHLQRTPAEKWWSRANTFIVVVQLACFLSVVIRTIAGASNSMSNSFFTNSVLSLKAPYIVDGCVYNVTRRHAFFNNVQYSLSRDNVGYFVSRAVLNIRYLIALAAAHVVVSATNRLWFETNTHEIRYHFVVFRKDMITTWEILLMVLSFVVTLGITEENRIMTDYITHCAANRSTSGHFYNSVQPYTELIVSYIISISATVINGAFAVWNLSKKNPLDLMLREAKRQQEEWRQAMEQYYGLGNSDATTAAQSQEHAGGTQPQVIYADNRATTVSPNADAAAALPVNGNELDEMKLNAPQPPPQFTPLPPQKQAHLQQQQPHFGPSVSRPLTPTLNEEYDQVEMPEVRQQGVGEGALGDRVGPTAEMMGGPGAVIESSNSGRYDLHEVDDDEDDERGAVMEADIKNSSLRGGQASYSVVGGAGGVSGGLRVRGMSGSEASTALVAAHLATTPPPPPVHSGDRRQQAQMSRGQMLAPPSPLQGGAETTDDTVHL
ncbi:putative integral membrane protein [Leishmania donovani]|uniref:Putative integral membrane protein n=1 Tax=Leishmania donovani TaxID=5661 RepID=A0A504Y665_LEIDO|nr:putative integral membrane protein [Leishmania donovani]